MAVQANLGHSMFSGHSPFSLLAQKYFATMVMPPTSKDHKMELVAPLSGVFIMMSEHLK